MSSSGYYRKRIEQELAAAERSADPSISQIHREMARRYRDLLDDQAVRLISDASPAQPVGGALAGPGTVHA